MTSAFARSRPKKAAVPSPASRAARACVSVMLPQPTKPAERATGKGLLPVLRRERLPGGLGLLRRERARQDRQPVMEDGRLPGRERERPLRFLAVRVGLRAEGVGREQAVATG